MNFIYIDKNSMFSNDTKFFMNVLLNNNKITI